jgi:hypothetical protein
MQRWMSQPVTRAEAIGWALLIPTAYYGWVTGYGMVRVMDSLAFSMRQWPDSVPASMSIWTTLGPVGVVIVCSLCVLVPLGALLSSQRPWLRVAAPLICLALLFSLQSQCMASLREMGQLLQAQHGSEAAAEVPK